jgi:hypothetical protein
MLDIHFPTVQAVMMLIAALVALKAGSMLSE